MKSAALFMIAFLVLAGCASAPKKAHCPVAVIKVSPANGGYVEHN